ncbi:hypothetical protein HZP84_15270 [Elizabethkingia anophelis]|uniref:Uncharacterized protein n=3 Tax=Elizabethkingia TaxID=308865 RepID=X5KRH7_9FLAO|nr:MULTISPECIES: hypothetical protein [Elizabethkingia]MCL1663566.1 hypothetical protein [Elizabethkingia ursingii]MDR2230552.1 hypothetical protein [Flavobacteriaceae bacterium]AQW90862.1 hypothetical protein BBD28_09405 [Elizabethkingia anophelis]AQW97439.1 hypothetical protein BBD31_05835 [Elizabethkingia anophelis]AQX01061.1 hypothetical protein BBD32_06120 [Elizabethkingia anophelis]
MNFLRNTFGVILGLFVAALIITLGVRLNPAWITYEQFAPFKRWEYLLYSVRNKDYFFVALLVSSGIGAMIGGVVTALVVKYAKVAYAILIGFILLFIAMLDVIIFPFHPTFYKISIFLIFFPFSWIGGKVVEVLTNKWSKIKKNKS